MGIDIIVVVEQQNADAEWKQVESDEEHGHWWLYGWYSMFAILTDEFNHSNTNHSQKLFNPIYPGRGIPEDCNERIRDRFTSYSGVTHYLLSELLEWNWDAYAGQVETVLYLEEFQQWQKDGSYQLRKCYFEKLVSNEEMMGLIARKEAGELVDKETKTLVRIDQSYRQAAGSDLFWLMEKLSERFAEPNQVRLTFGFYF